MSRRWLSFATLAALAATPAGAHEYWLAPSRYRAAAGDTVAVGGFVGTGFRGEARPFAARRASRFDLAGARTRSLVPAAVDGATPWASFVAADDQGAMVAYQSDFATIELAAPEFDDYLRLEGLTGPLGARQQPGTPLGAVRERYARCPKTWIAGTRPGASERAQHPAGLRLEIVPLADPGQADPLTVRVLWGGRPLAGALVRAWNLPLAAGGSPARAAERDSVGPRVEVVSDGRGEARIALGSPGEWLIGTVHMERSADPGQADWESWWASLTFARGPWPR